ncbi:protein repA [Campylobacter jejuni]|nr:protein repA [Campylobacter jejuni]
MYVILNLYIQWKYEGVKMDKIKITLSIPVDTNEKLAELAKANGMTKSGLVNFLVNQLANKSGDLYSN